MSRDLTKTITYAQASTGFGLFECSVRTADHLDYTKERLAKEFPGAQLVIIQGCYNRANPSSAGTHDFDCCLDVRIVGLGWDDAQAFLRRCGWAAWWRKPWQGPWDDHIHMISLGFLKYGLLVGIFVDGGLSTRGSLITSSQVVDYYNHSYGLAGDHAPGADPSWFPPDIDATVRDFERWEAELEDDMPAPKDWDTKDWDAVRKNLVPQIATAVWMWDGFNKAKDKAKALLLLASGK